MVLRRLVGMATVGVLFLALAPLANGREWADSTGKYRIEASLVRVEAGNAVLRKSDGSIVSIPIARLSLADQAFLNPAKPVTPERPEPIPDGPATTPERPVSAPATMTDDEILTQLMRPPKSESFKGIELKSVIETLLGRQIPMVIDARALSLIGRNPNAPVTFDSHKEMSRLVNLNAMLAPAKMGIVVKHGVVLVTSTDEANAMTGVSVYRLHRPQRFDPIIGTITTKLVPDSWADVGGVGEIAPIQPLYLAIAHTLPMRLKIAETYDKTMRLVAPPARRRVKGMSVAAALESAVSLTFRETPLQDAIAILADKHGVEMEIDTDALTDIGLARDVPITLDVKNVKLKAALWIMLRDLDLVAIPGDDKIMVTSESRASTVLVDRTYPAGPFKRNVREVVEAIELIKPSGWSKLGGASSVRATRTTIEVSAPVATHEEIAVLLATLGIKW